MPQPKDMIEAVAQRGIRTRLAPVAPTTSEDAPSNPQRPADSLTGTMCLLQEDRSLRQGIDCDLIADLVLEDGVAAGDEGDILAALVLVDSGCCDRGCLDDVG